MDLLDQELLSNQYDEISNSQFDQLSDVNYIPDKHNAFDDLAKIFKENEKMTHINPLEKD